MSAYEDDIERWADSWGDEYEDYDMSSIAFPWSDWTPEEKRAYWEKKNAETARRVFKPVHRETPIL